MENDLLGIGRVAAASGLSVSALRFYDGAGVLRPAVVDPVSGYRYYDAAAVRQARVVAHLRRVGLPLDDIRAVLAGPADAAAVLAAHLRRLEAGLADARSEISLVHRLLDDQETIVTRFTLPAAGFLRALRDVRHAVGADPATPALNGIFLDSEPGRLRLVATGRYRLATSVVAADVPENIRVLLPTGLADDLLAADPTGSLDVEVDDATVTVSGRHGTLRAEIRDVDFPAYRTWLEAGRREVPVGSDILRRALHAGATDRLTRETDGVTFDVSRLSVTAAGVEVGTSDEPGAVVVGVNRDFLLQALDCGDQLTLGLDGPITPLAVRNPARDGVLSILMPVRLGQPA